MIRFNIVFVFSVSFLFLRSTALEVRVNKVSQPSLYPEGIAYDPTTGMLYLSSATSPVIIQADPNGGSPFPSQVVIFDTSLPEGSVYLGGHVDPVKNRLYFAVTSFSPNSYSALVAYDLDNFSQLFLVEFPCSLSTADCEVWSVQANDVFVDDKGDYAYVTDSGTGVLWKVDTEAQTFSVLSDSELLRSQAGSSGANGVAIHEDLLIVSNYGESSLIKVDVESGVAEAVELAVDLHGPDGILFLEDGRLVVVTGSMTLLLECTSEDCLMMDQIDYLDFNGLPVSSTAAFHRDVNSVYVTHPDFGALAVGDFSVSSFTVTEITFAALDDGDDQDEDMDDESDEEEEEEEESIGESSNTININFAYMLAGQ